MVIGERATEAWLVTMCDIRHHFLLHHFLGLLALFWIEQTTQKSINLSLYVSVCEKYSSGPAP